MMNTNMQTASRHMRNPDWTMTIYPRTAMGNITTCSIEDKQDRRLLRWIPSFVLTRLICFFFELEELFAGEGGELWGQSLHAPFIWQPRIMGTITHGGIPNHLNEAFARTTKQLEINALIHAWRTYGVISLQPPKRKSLLGAI